MRNSIYDKHLRSIATLVLVLCATGLGGAEPATVGSAGAAQPAPTGPVPPTGAQALLAQGWEAVRVANWPGAIEAFGRVGQVAGATDEDRGAACYGEAYCWQYRALDTDRERARELYRRAANEYPQTRAAPYAMMELARLADMPLSEGERRPEDAAALYRRLIEAHPDHVLADEATLWLAVQLTGAGEEARRGEGVALVEARLARRPDGPLAAMMHRFLALEAVYRGTEADEEGPFRQALEHYRRCIDLGLPTAQMQVMVLIHAARIAELRLQDYAAAIALYRRVVDEHPNENWSPVAELAIEHCRRLREEQDGKTTEEGGDG